PEPEPAPKGEPFTLPDAIKLPVAVRIDRLALDSVSVTPAPDAEPVVLKQALLQGAWLGGEQWRIESLTAHGPLFDIATNAEVTPSGRYVTQLAADVSLRLPDLAPINTELRVSGDLDRLAVKQQVAAPYNVALEAQITDVAFDALKRIGIDATLALEQTRLTAIREDLPDIAPITTELHVTGTPQKLKVKQTVAAPYSAKLAAT